MARPRVFLSSTFYDLKYIWVAFGIVGIVGIGSD
jgi:hypothetical protein